MRQLIIISLLLFTVTLYAQKDVKPTIFTKATSGQLITLRLDLSEYNPSIISKLNEDLKKYSDKIIQTKVDRNRKRLKIVYNEHMLIEDFIRTFEINGVGYYAKDTTPKLPNNTTY
jgi:hypothetical protein